MPPNDTYDKLADLFGYEAHEEDLDEKEYALAILMLLETFYRKYNTKSLNYYTNHFDDDCKKLEEQLLKKNETYFNKYASNKRKQELLKYEIPSSKHKQIPQFNLQSTKEVMELTIKKAINYLREDVALKIKVWKDRQEKESEFQVNEKLNRFVKDIKKGIKYTTNLVYQKTMRGTQEFVYGSDARFRWVCGGSDPCSWCRLQEKKDPQPLNAWAFDHMNGYCYLEPSDDKTSKAFNKLLGIDD